MTYLSWDKYLDPLLTTSCVLYPKLVLAITDSILDPNLSVQVCSY